MGKIFFVMGKSATGKDTVYKTLLERLPKLKKVILYTTRPVRDGEKNGVEYYFTDREGLEKFRRNGRLKREHMRRFMVRGVILPWMTDRLIYLKKITI